MPSKYYNRNFRSQYFYHVFNRGAYKNKIFLDNEDYEIFTSIMEYYLKFPRTRNFAYKKKINEFQVPNLEEEITVHLVAYCLMPNHFHLLLKQLPGINKKTNISNLMRRLMITYSMYFQNKYKHEGAVFQGKYKNVVVDLDEQLVYLSKYIHLNPRNPGQYQFSSYQAYIQKTGLPKWLHPEYVFKLQKNYQIFVEQPMDNKQFEKLKKLLLE
jgi:putative transposase